MDTFSGLSYVVIHTPPGIQSSIWHSFCWDSCDLIWLTLKFRLLLKITHFYVKKWHCVTEMFVFCKLCFLSHIQRPWTKLIQFAQNSMAILLAFCTMASWKRVTCGHERWWNIHEHFQMTSASKHSLKMKVCTQQYWRPSERPWGPQQISLSHYRQLQTAIHTLD